MTLSEYFRIIKSNMGESVSNEDLMNLLFGDIIRQANLRGKDGDFYQFDASRTSRILSGQLSINKDIIGAINKETIIESLPTYFSNAIIPRLSNKEEVLYTLQERINNDGSISHSEKVTYRMLWNVDFLHILLARMLLKSIFESKNPIPKSHQQEGNKLHLKTITGINDISPSLKMRICRGPHKKTLDNLKITIQRTYEHINSMICQKENQNKIKDIEEYIPSGIIGAMASFPPKYTSVTISNKDKEKIEIYARINAIKMSTNFFNLGNLHEERELTITVWPNASEVKLIGNPREKKKYNLINKLLDMIDRADVLQMFINSFDDYYIVKFLLENSSKIQDSDITVTLELPAKTLFTIDDLKSISRYTLEKIDANYNFHELFSISKNRKFLSYYEAAEPDSVFDPPSSSILGILGKTDEEFYKEKWHEIFSRRYFYSEEDGKSYIQIHFDKLLQNMSVAFPTSILLKERIDKISYKIQSANMPDVLYGKLFTEEGTTNG